MGPGHRGECLPEVKLLLGKQGVGVLPRLIGSIKDEGVGLLGEAWVVVGERRLFKSLVGMGVIAVLGIEGLLIASLH